MIDYKRTDEYLKQHLDESIAELSVLAAQPSVAAQNWGLHECAEFSCRNASQKRLFG